MLQIAIFVLNKTTANGNKTCAQLNVIFKQNWEMLSEFRCYALYFWARLFSFIYLFIHLEPIIWVVV